LREPIDSPHFLRRISMHQNRTRSEPYGWTRPLRG
jgi:hypothetical protein